MFSGCYWPELQLRVYLMKFTWPFTSAKSPKGGIIIMWSIRRTFFEVTSFQWISSSLVWRSSWMNTSFALSSYYLNCSTWYQNPLCNFLCSWWIWADSSSSQEDYPSRHLIKLTRTWIWNSLFMLYLMSIS